MSLAALKLIAFRAIAFASTMVMSVAVVGSLPKFKERRQRYFASAATSGSVYRMQLLHLAGANINSRGSSGTPLFLAAGEGRLNAVRYLLDEGADVNLRGEYGNTALTEATYYGHASVIKELVMRGAEVNVISIDGTPLDIAAGRNNSAVIDLLKHYGAKRGNELR
ncbi:MAG TPA: ankyrin repeat domain-containing protein [Pyrinomonadaceae bacterium]|jgi:ankyrin repeat protein|nr:ankyrin repeat domain-containing protein [Pyrinomonadaceae bacterium]